MLKFFFAFYILLLPLMAQAGDPSTKDLKAIENNLADEKDRQAELKKQEDALDDKVGDLKKQLVTSATKVQTLEKELSDVEGQLKDLSVQEKNKQDDIARQRLRLSRITAAWLRLARTPPELLLFAPLPPPQIIQAGATFHHVVPLLYNEAEKAKADLLQLQELQNQLKAKQDNAAKVQASLQTSQDELSALLNTQEDKRNEASERRQDQDSKVASLASRAADLRDLLKKLEAEKAKNKAVKPRISPGRKSFANPNVMPVAGSIQRNYGDKDDVGAVSRGISIAARSGATVTAPFDGEVQYAGNFRSYGNIVILTRDDGLHALLAGFGKINAKRGDQIGRGEPLGVLPNKSTPQLYVEYRKGTEPIDPGALNLSDSKPAT